MHLRNVALFFAIVALGLTSCSQRVGTWEISIWDESGSLLGSLEISVKPDPHEDGRTFIGKIVSISGLAEYPIGKEAELRVGSETFRADLNPGYHDNNTYLEGSISGTLAKGKVTLARGPMGHPVGTFTATFAGG